MEIKTGVFRAYDIRGLYPTDINEEFAYKLGRAYVHFLRLEKKIDVQNILVNRDTRASSSSLYQALIKGITEGGVSVFEGGVSTTPMHYFGVGTFDIQAGIMVTASHGAPDLNGFKLSTKTERIASDTGLLNLSALIEAEFPPSEKVGSVRELSFIDQYIDFLKKFILFPNVSVRHHVAIDASGGAAGMVLDALLSHVPIEATKLFFEPDPAFRTHNPNPLLPESQQFIKKVLEGSHQEFGVIFDGDADRAVFFDEHGAEVPNDYIAALIAEEKLRVNSSRKTVLLDVNASRRSREYVEKSNGFVQIVRVGTAFFRNALQRDPTVLLGAESSGHFYFPEFFNSDAAILAFIYVLNIVARANQPLSELVAPMRTSARSGEINFQVKDKESLLEKIKEKFNDAKITTIDGLMVEYKDWWFNIRPSNTERVIRLHIEADSKKLLDEKQAVLQPLISSH
jgi:phosphomannomutase